MKAVITKEANAPFEVVNDVEKPKPGPGQILVKSIAAAINPVWVSFFLSFFFFFALLSFILLDCISSRQTQLAVAAAATTTTTTGRRKKRKQEKRRNKNDVYPSTQEWWKGSFLNEHEREWRNNPIFYYYLFIFLKFKIYFNGLML